MPRHEKTNVLHMQKRAYAKTKTQISFAVTAKLISAFVFAICIVQCLYFLNAKYHASWLHSRVCDRPGQNPHCWFSHVAAHIFTTLQHLNISISKCLFYSTVYLIYTWNCPLMTSKPKYVFLKICYKQFLNENAGYSSECHEAINIKNLSVISYVNHVSFVCAYVRFRLFSWLRSFCLFQWISTIQSLNE